MPVEKQALNRISNDPDKTLLSKFKIGIVILKRPVAFELFRLAISSSISTAVVGKRKKLFDEGEPIYSRGDLSTFGILLAKLQPIVEKNLLKVFPIDLGVS